MVLLYLTKLTQEIKFEDIGKSSLTFIVLLKWCALAAFIDVKATSVKYWT